MPGIPLDLLDQLDGSLARIRIASRRPAHRRRLLQGLTHLHALAELRLLRAVERRASDGGAPSIGEVAREMGIEQSTASRSVAHAVEAGLLVRLPSAGDQRRCTLELTDLGRAGLAETTARRRDILAKTVSNWSREDLKLLASLMGRLAHDLDEENNRDES